jgi:hypothetical protein
MFNPPTAAKFFVESFSEIWMLLTNDDKKDFISTIFEIMFLKCFFLCGRIRPPGSYRGGVRTADLTTA